MLCLLVKLFWIVLIVCFWVINDCFALLILVVCVIWFCFWLFVLGFLFNCLRWVVWFAFSVVSCFRLVLGCWLLSERFCGIWYFSGIAVFELVFPGV